MPTNKKPVTRQNLPQNPIQSLHYFTEPTQRAKISMIATPIGNLSDITARAMKTIEECDELWCEDTRHTLALINALGLKAPRTRRVDHHIEETELRALLTRVSEQGQHIGVVTDAGTPGLSDPGSKIIECIMDFPAIRIEPIVGPSALTSFISIAGFEDNSFSFQGFFPRHLPDAKKLLTELSDIALIRNWIFFESPMRIRETIEILTDWSKQLDFIPKFIFAKEMSKLHETIWMGFGVQFLEYLLQQHFDERGEWVVAVSLPKNCVKKEKDESFWMLSLECLLQAEVPTKVAAQIISQRYGIAKNLAYQKALEFQKKIKNSDA